MLNQKRDTGDSRVKPIFLLSGMNDRDIFNNMWENVDNNLNLSQNELEIVKEQCFNKVKHELKIELEKIYNDPKKSLMTIDELKNIYN